jgi:(1->4)-alpha-D-glucan 1-alpha-D-glucosylmutase
VLRIVRNLDPALPPADADLPTADSTTDAVAELLACFPTYRSYLPDGSGDLDRAVVKAKNQRPDLAAALECVAAVLVDPSQPAAVRFQQTSGMVMAKGVEDCAFYRWNHLGSLTEVGGDVDIAAITGAEFHRRQQVRQASWPASMTTLTTHDTKRGEDVRARLDALTEMPEMWLAALERLHDLAPLTDPVFEQLLWQAAVGAWPITADRLHAYAEKAAREAGTSTTWAQPAAGFEQAVHATIDRLFAEPPLKAAVEEVVAATQVAGWINSLTAKLVRLTAPGVPDVYQGSELWERSLVDPDNRRPVDYDLRRRHLAAAAREWRMARHRHHAAPRPPRRHDHGAPVHGRRAAAQ